MTKNVSIEFDKYVRDGGDAHYTSLIGILGILSLADSRLGEFYPLLKKGTSLERTYEIYTGKNRRYRPCGKKFFKYCCIVNGQALERSTG